MAARGPRLEHHSNIVRGSDAVVRIDGTQTTSQIAEPIGLGSAVAWQCLRTLFGARSLARLAEIDYDPAPCAR